MFCVVLLLAVAFQISESIAVKDKPQLDFTNISECSRLNMAAIETADVLILQESIMDTTKPAETGGLTGVLISEKKSIRIKFDLPNERFAYVAMSELQGVDFDAVDPGEEGQEVFAVRRYGTWFDGERGSVVNYRDGEVHRQQRSSFPADKYEFMQTIGFPNPRSLGRTGSFGSWESIALDQPVSPTVTASGKSVISVKRVGNFVRIVSENEQQNLPGIILRFDRTYDVRNLMLHRFHLDLIDSERKSKNRFSDVELEWSEIKGIQVPVSVQRTKQSFFFVNGRKVTGDKDTTSKIHWFSVNKNPFQNKFFSSLDNLDEKIMHRLLDPAAAGAKSLLETKVDFKIKVRADSE